jgi:hypothetical protein
MNQQRDPGITRIHARPGRLAYGMGLGIMLVDEVYPGFPGDVRNASAFPFPIQYDVVSGVDIYKLCTAEDKSPCLQPILDAAQRLERWGCRAIAGECGYFAYFQPEVAAAVDVPVFMSSLLQVSWLQQLVGSSGRVGILASVRRDLTDTHLRKVGVDPDSVIVTGAMDDYECPQFDSLWEADKRPEIATSEYAASEEDIVRISKDFVCRNPSIKALVLECTGFQPFARAIQREIDIPVASWGTLLDYAYALTVHRDYYGHV